MAEILRAIRDAQSKSCEQSQVVLDNDELLVAWDPPIVFKNRALVEIVVKQNVRAVANKQRIIRVTDGVSDDEILRALASSSPLGLPSAAYNAMHREFHPFTCKKCSSVHVKEDYQAHVAACEVGAPQPKSVQKAGNQKRPANVEEGSVGGQKSRAKRSIKDFMDRLPKRQRIDSPVVSGNERLDQAAPIELLASSDCKSLPCEDSSANVDQHGRSAQDDAPTQPKKKRGRASNNGKCEAPNCTKRPFYNVVGSQPIRCGDHRQHCDINVVTKKCAEPGCTVRPTFNAVGSKVGERCKKHKKVDDVDVINKRCNEPGCSTLNPHFGVAGSKRGERCSKHKKVEDVNVCYKKCAEPGCMLHPSFNAPGSKRGERCSKHKKAGEVDVRSRKCSAPGCASFNVAFGIEGSKRGERCSKHKRVGDVDVKGKKCSELGCITSHPAFNRPGTKRGKRCGKHKRAGDVDVYNKKCSEPGCTVRPNFNRPGSQLGERCKKHKRAGDVDVLHNTCAEPGCTLHPSFGADGSKRAERCHKHKKEGDVDVCHKKCAVGECTTRVSYGNPGHAPTHCSPHKLDGQIVHPKRKCESCSGLAMFGVTTAERCETHMREGDHDHVQRACKSCGLIELVGEDSKCGACDPKVFLHMRLRKQREIRALLMQSDLPPFETYDVPLQAGVCGKERPDFTWASGTILEIDEWQHKFGYNPECERIRMVNITAAMGMPTLWIRFSPDDYVGWRSGMRTRERHEYLVRFLRQQLSEPQLETRVVYLFYDHFTGKPEFKPLDVLPTAHAVS